MINILIKNVSVYLLIISASIIYTSACRVYSITSARIVYKTYIMYIHYILMVRSYRPRDYIITQLTSELKFCLRNA